MKTIKAVDYQWLLQTKSGTVPDPMADLTTGWIGEENGMEQWPPTKLLEIQGEISFICCQCPTVNSFCNVITIYSFTS